MYVRTNDNLLYLGAGRSRSSVNAGDLGRMIPCMGEEGANLAWLQRFAAMPVATYHKHVRGTAVGASAATIGVDAASVFPGFVAKPAGAKLPAPVARAQIGSRSRTTESIVPCG